MYKLLCFALLSLVTVSACVPSQVKTNTTANVNTSANNGQVNTNADVNTDVMMEKNDTDTTNDDSMKDTSMMKGDEDAMMENNDDSGSDTNSMEVDATTSSEVNFTGTVLAGTDAPYIEFNEEDFNKAKAAGKNIMLYFYANWCPTCRAEEPQIFAAFESFTKADNVVGFRVNFKDTETSSLEKELATEYGVRYQHTRVFLKGEQYISTTAATPWVTLDYLENVRAEFGIN